ALPVFAADLGPGQAGDHADLVVLLGAAVVVAAHAQVLLEVAGGNAHRPGAGGLRGLRRPGGPGALLRRRRPGQGDLLDHLAADPGDLALQVAHAGLARVIAHDVAERAFGDLQLSFL